MAKAKRGRNLHKQAGWRGTCPSCNRTGAKLLWEKTVDDKKLKVCKICGN